MIFTNRSATSRSSIFPAGRLSCTAGEREAPRRLTSADVPALAALYDKLVPKCRIERDTAYWNAQLALFDTLGAGVYGWFKDGTLTGYAFCWEDNAQELLGADDAQLQGLLDVLRPRYARRDGDRRGNCTRRMQMA